MVTTYVNPRFSGLLRQIAVEMHLCRGEYPDAVFALRDAHRTLLYDVTWLERCPLLTPIRGTREVQAVLAEVKMRCDEVWTK
jgi:serine/threonine-protein kinase